MKVGDIIRMVDFSFSLYVIFLFFETYFLFSRALKVRCMNSSGGVISMIGDVLCQQVSSVSV